MRQLHDRLELLDGLRGLAILLVVWYHAWLVTGQQLSGINVVAQAGYLGVDLFFFISGFCLFAPHARALVSGGAIPSTRRFFARRVLKIVPSYLLAIAVFAIVYRARFGSPGDELAHVAGHLLFLHTLWPAAFGSLSGPLWTLGVEVQFYLIFPVVAALFRRAPVATYLALVALAETYRLAIDGLGASSDFFAINQLPAYLDVFGAGLFAAWLVAGGRLGAPASPLVRRLLPALPLAIVAAGVTYFGSLGPDGNEVASVHEALNRWRIVIGPACLALTLALAVGAPSWQRAFGWAPLTFLSTISYNLYLWNLEIAVWLRETPLAPAVAFALALGISLLVATCITFAVERPILFGRPLAVMRRNGSRRPAFP